MNGIGEQHLYLKGRRVNILLLDRSKRPKETLSINTSESGPINGSPERRRLGKIRPCAC